MTTGPNERGIASEGKTTITLFHDIEQNVNCDADREACRRVVKDMLSLERRYGIRTTYNVVGRLFSEQPDLIDWIRGEGHEIAFHSYHHLYDCRANEFRNEVRLCRKISPEPRGYRSPQSRWNQDTLEGLCAHGFSWNAESDKAAAPYVILGELVRLPISGDDWSLHRDGLAAERWVDTFFRLLGTKPYIAFGSHDCVASLAPVDRLGAWERIVRMALENGCRIEPFGEAADRVHAGPLLGSR